MRGFNLGADGYEADIKASFKDGILELQAPKVVEKEVNTACGNGASLPQKQRGKLVMRYCNPVLGVSLYTLLEEGALRCGFGPN